MHRGVRSSVDAGRPVSLRAAVCVSPAQILASGATIERIDRGGELTFHGPGQLVMYPIFSLRDLGVGARAFVKGLETSMVSTLGAWGLHAKGDPATSAGVRLRV